MQWSTVQRYPRGLASYFGDHLTSESLFTTELVGKIVAELKTGRAVACWYRRVDC